MVRPVWWSDIEHITGQTGYMLLNRNFGLSMGSGLKSHLCYTNFFFRFYCYTLHPSHVHPPTNGDACKEQNQLYLGV